MIVVLDSNVWASAFLAPRGVPGSILTLVRMGLLRAVSSSRLWNELALRALGAIGGIQVVTPRELLTELEAIGIVVT